MWKALLLVAFLFLTIGFAQTNYSGYLYKLATDSRTIANTKPITSKPFPGTIQYDISSQPQIAQSITLIKRVDDKNYWIMNLENPTISSYETVWTTQVRLLENSADFRTEEILSGVFKGCVYQLTRVTNTASIYSRKAAIKNLLLH